MNAVYFMNLPYEKINNSLPFTPQASFQNSPGTGLSRNTSHAIYTQLHTICINTLTYCTYRAVNIQTEYYVFYLPS